MKKISATFDEIVLITDARHIVLAVYYLCDDNRLLTVVKSIPTKYEELLYVKPLVIEGWSVQYDFTAQDNCTTNRGV